MRSTHRGDSFQNVQIFTVTGRCRCPIMTGICQRTVTMTFPGYVGLSSLALDARRVLVCLGVGVVSKIPGVNDK